MGVYAKTKEGRIWYSCISTKRFRRALLTYHRMKRKQWRDFLLRKEVGRIKWKVFKPGREGKTEFLT